MINSHISTRYWNTLRKLQKKKINQDSYNANLFSLFVVVGYTSKLELSELTFEMFNSNSHTEQTKLLAFNTLWSFLSETWTVMEGRLPEILILRKAEKELMHLTFTAVLS